jgi:hypothetical protein
LEFNKKGGMRHPITPRSSLLKILKKLNRGTEKISFLNQEKPKARMKKFD